MSPSLYTGLKYFILVIGLTLFGFGIVLGTKQGRDSDGSVTMIIIGAALIALGLIQ